MRKRSLTINQLRKAWSIAVCCAFSAPAWAGQTFTMTFNDIPKAGGVMGQQFGSAVLGFYNDDGRNGSQPWNTTFSANALAICPAIDPDIKREVEAECFGRAPPSSAGGESYVGTVVDTSIEFALTSQFLSDLSFLYYLASGDARASVELLSAEGALVRTIPLPGCEGSCNWRQYGGLGFGKSLDGDDGVTQVRFLSTKNSAVFDDVSVTAVEGTTIPEPSTYALMATGLALLVGVRRRRASR